MSEPQLGTTELLPQGIFGYSVLFWLLPEALRYSWPQIRNKTGEYAALDAWIYDSVPGLARDHVSESENIRIRMWHQRV